MSTQFYACDAANVQPDGTCSQPVWVDSPTVIPPLSVSDANAIWPEIAVMWAIGFGVRAIRRLMGV